MKIDFKIFKKITFIFQVERAVKLLSEAALHSSTNDGIHKYCLNALENYDKLPSTAKKQDFINLAKKKS